MTSKTQTYYDQIITVLDQAKKELSTKEYLELCEEVESIADERYQAEEPTTEEDTWDEDWEALEEDMPDIDE